jgi:hypothetical protein
MTIHASSTAATVDWRIGSAMEVKEN